MKKQYFILLIALLTALTSTAQRKKKRVSEVGVFLGGSYYIGELNPLHHVDQFTKPACGFLFRYNINKRVAGRFNFMVGSVEAHDSFSESEAARQRNLSFKSPINEASLQLEFNFLDYQIGMEKHKFSPYIFLGVGVFKFNPQGQLNNNWVALQPLGTEGQGLEGGATRKKYKLVQMCIPFGVGAKANLSKNIGLGFEWGMRKTFTDYLDDVSKRYYNPAILAAARGGTAAAMSDPSIGTDPAFNNTGRQRGNPTNKDWYSFIGVTLTVKLKDRPETCPAVN